MPFSRSRLARRKTVLFSLFLAPLGFAAWGSAQAATTYHVRIDGGTSAQCTGRADAPYPGSGTGKACAWSHPFFALGPGGVKRIAGGDTVVIGSGSYMMGKGAPGAGSCSASNCVMAPIPSGPGSTARTRFIGKSRTSPPRLWGSGGASKILNLDGSSNVEVGNLEITDQHDCVYNHSNSTANCPGTGSGAWAKTGLSAKASKNVWLHDVNIHGLAAQGILAGGLTNWNVERVRMIANGRVGWGGNIGSGSSNSGSIVLRDIEIAWNGCGERWKTGAPWACWAQQTGGYGDGLGTEYTGGQWLIEDAFIHHNTSDGLDLRYMDGADGTQVTVRRLYAVGNAGNQAKIRGNSLVENSVIISDCSYFEGKYYMLKDDNCRANGNSLQLVMTANDTATVRHNTITGEGGTLIGTGEGDGSGKVRIENNVLVGFPTYRSPSTLASASYGNFPGSVSFKGNLLWNVKGSCLSGSVCGKNPKLTNMTLASFDGEPLAGSPVIDQAPMITAVTLDFLMGKRPTGAANDIGAYEYGAISSAPAPGSYINAKADDFNGDGVADVLWRHAANGAETIWNSANAATTQPTIGVNLDWSIVGKGDFNGDGVADILWRNLRDGRNVIWKSGNFATPQAVTTVPNKAWRVVGTGDFDGDGRDDILWRNAGTGGNSIWKAASSANEQRMSTVSNLAWKIVGVGDFNADGRDDVLWRHGGTGANAIWHSGNSAASQALTQVATQAWQVAGVGDFNGDGKDDILWRHASTGANAIWKSAMSASTQYVVGVTDLSWQMVAVADYNGDGKDDVLWRHQLSGWNAIWPSASYASRRNIASVANQAWKVQ